MNAGNARPITIAGMTEKINKDCELRIDNKQRPHTIAEMIMASIISLFLVLLFSISKICLCVSLYLSKISPTGCSCYALLISKFCLYPALYRFHGTGDLVYPSGMAPSFKIGVHENVNHFFCIPFPHKPGRYANDICIVMFPGQLGDLLSPA